MLQGLAQCRRSFLQRRKQPLVWRKQSDNRRRANYSSTQCLLETDPPSEPARKQYYHNKGNAQQLDSHAQNIFPGDLAATLEAHRAANRASLIRKCSVGEQTEGFSSRRPVNASTDTKAQPSQSSLSGENTEASHVSHTSYASTKKPFKITYVKGQSQRSIPSHVPSRYAGVYVSPARRKAGLPHVRYLGRPHMLDSVESDKRDRLNGEILRFAEYVRPTKCEKIVRQKIVNKLANALKSKIPDVQLEYFGSQKNGTAMSTSDVDISCCLPSEMMPLPGDPGSGGRASSIQFLKNARRAICQVMGVSCDVSPIVYARYPLIRVQHKPTEIDVQFVAGTSGLASCDYVRSYLDEYRSLWPVYALCKTALDVRQLSDVFQGGLSAYPLLMMIVTCFKLKSISSRDDVSRALLTFLTFYSESNTNLNAFSVEPPMMFSKDSDEDAEFQIYDTAEDGNVEESQQATHLRQQQLLRLNKETPHLLSLQDPADPTNDLGRKSHRILDITATFMHLKTLLQSWLDDTAPGPAPARRSPLDPFVGFKLQDVQTRRVLAERYLAEQAKWWRSRGHAAPSASSVRLSSFDPLKAAGALESDGGAGAATHADGWPRQV